MKTAKKEYDKTEDDLKALQSVGQIIGEVLKQLDEERCEFLHKCRLHIRHLLRLKLLVGAAGYEVSFLLAIPLLGSLSRAESSRYADFDKDACDTSNQLILLVLIAAVIVKASSGPRYVVGCRNKVDKAKLVAGTRVALDMTTLTIMRFLPREVRSSFTIGSSSV